MGLSTRSVRRIAESGQNAQEPTFTNYDEDMTVTQRLKEEAATAKKELASLREELVQAKQRAAALAGKGARTGKPSKNAV